MASVRDLNTYLDAAIVHIQAGEYSSARQDLLAARAALMSVPDTDRIRWRQEIDDLWEKLTALMREEESTYRPKRVLLKRGGL